MSIIDKSGSDYGDKSGAEVADPPEIEVPSGMNKAGKKMALPKAGKYGKYGQHEKPAKPDKPARPLIDFDDANAKVRWKTILDRQRTDLATNLLTISRPRTKLDPIAEGALKTLHEQFMGDPEEAEELEQRVRAAITRKGIASQVKKVTDRLNRRRMTEGRRFVLATTYLFLLWKLVRGDDKAVKKQMEDDLGVAEEIMLDMEARDGPFDVFANLIVESVITRNRLKKSETLLEIVSQQVRAAI